MDKLGFTDKIGLPSAPSFAFAKLVLRETPLNTFYGSFADAKPIFTVRRGRAGGGEQHSPVERVILFCRAVLF